MKNIIRSTSFLASLVAMTLLTGCGTMGGPYGPTDRNGTYDPYEQRLDNVRGTIERVDTRAQTIVVTPESGYRSNLRNGNEEVVLAYDSRTTVEFQGRTFRPEDLEPGDRILAEVTPSSRSYDRPLVGEIQVLYDVSSGAGDNGGYNNGGYNNGGYNNRYSTNLRGIVRYVDTNNRAIQVDTSSRGFSNGQSGSGQSGVVTVYYDSGTTVEFQGRRYQPENLERGDEVEIDTRDASGGRLMADQITVVNDARSR
ncbi:MAG TPA: hypothetical protein VEW48_07290 [Thermoanaerobaculia bacterium]|nr:hypothetical protein [Thermoanaerobaculia bacterium]